MELLKELIVFDLTIGFVMYLYLWVTWVKLKGAIKICGWNLDYANPVMFKDCWRYFIPILGIVYYLVAGTAMNEMSRLKKNDCGGLVIVRICNFDFTYAEPIA